MGRRRSCFEVTLLGEPSTSIDELGQTIELA